MTEYFRPDLPVPVSEWPSNIIPQWAVAFSCGEDGCTVKGFYDPETGEMHVQEVIHLRPEVQP